MNERLKQLAIESKLIAPEYNGFDHTRLSISQQRFAELIVGECIKKIETHEIPVGNSAAGEIACEMTYIALRQLRAEIKQHFGVEE